MIYRPAARSSASGQLAADCGAESDAVSRSAGHGWFDPKRKASDYQLVSTNIGIDKPFDVKTAHADQFLDPSIKMIDAKEP